MSYVPPRLVVDRAAALEDAGRTEEALAEVERGLASHPEEAVLHALRADLLTYLDRSEEAVRAARLAVTSDPEMGYAYAALARALLDHGKDKDGAVAAARTAVDLDPTDQARYTLVRALLTKRRNLARAEQVAEALRSESPHSTLGPLALALVAMRRAGVLTRRTWSWWTIAALVAFTRGGAGLAMSIWWVTAAIRRPPHLRAADRHIHEALALKPESAHLRTMASEVLALRFRYGRAVDYQVNAAALEANLVDADELVGSISRRLTLALVIGFFGWILAASVLDSLASDTVTGMVAAAVAVVGIGAAVRFRQRQSEALPRPLRTALDARRGPLIAVAVITTMLAVAGGSYFGDQEGPRGYWLAAALLFPIGVAATGLLLFRFWGSNRAL